MEKQEIKIALEPIPVFLSSIMAIHDEENFQLLMISGTQGRNYVLSPKHAKRLLLLLQQQVADYEKKFGELITSLPVATPNQTEEKKIGF